LRTSPPPVFGETSRHTSIIRILASQSSFFSRNREASPKALIPLSCQPAFCMTVRLRIDRRNNALNPISVFAFLFIAHRNKCFSCESTHPLMQLGRLARKSLDLRVNLRVRAQNPSDCSGIPSRNLPRENCCSIFGRQLSLSGVNSRELIKRTVVKHRQRVFHYGV
jgi:hypothetical protein